MELSSASAAAAAAAAAGPGFFFPCSCRGYRIPHMAAGNPRLLVVWSRRLIRDCNKVWS